MKKLKSTITASELVFSLKKTMDGIIGENIPKYLEELTNLAQCKMFKNNNNINKLM